MGVTDGRDQNGDDDMDAIDDRQNVTITVTNVNEAPVVTGDASLLRLQENSSAAIATYTGTDPERDTLTWTVSATPPTSGFPSGASCYFRTAAQLRGPDVRTPLTVTATDDDDTTPLSGSLAT